MKETELMIGDWIKVLSISHKVEPHYDRIESIRKEYTGQIYIEGGYHDREHNGVRDWFDWSVGLEYIVPIPLTAEILHKNGFKLSEIPDEYYNDFEPSRFWEYSTDTKESLNINIKIDENVNTSIDVHNGDGVQMLQYFTDRNILYVHELQHALRLVGLTEVADNLKVE